MEHAVADGPTEPVADGPDPVADIPEREAEAPEPVADGPDAVMEGLTLPDAEPVAEAVMMLPETVAVGLPPPFVIASTVTYVW